MSDGARIAIDEQHADFIAQRGADEAAVVGRQRIGRAERDRGIARATAGGEGGEEALGLLLVWPELELAARDDVIGDRERELDLLRGVAEIADLGVEAHAARAGAWIRIDLEVRDREVRHRARAHIERDEGGAVFSPRCLVGLDARFCDERDQEHRLSLVARGREQVGGAGQRAGGIGGACARFEREQLIAKAQVIARQLGRLLGTLGGTHDRDLGFGTELGEDAARFIARTLDPRLALDQIAGGKRVIDHEHRGLRAAGDLRALAFARGERLRECDSDREAGEGTDE